MQAAVVAKNLPEIPQAGGEMVKTCYQLGLSEADRITPGKATNTSSG
jgi:hypothetical protein